MMLAFTATKDATDLAHPLLECQEEHADDDEHDERVRTHAAFFRRVVAPYNLPSTIAVPFTIGTGTKYA